MEPLCHTYTVSLTTTSLWPPTYSLIKLFIPTRDGYNQGFNPPLAGGSQTQMLTPATFITFCFQEKTSIFSFIS